MPTRIVAAVLALLAVLPLWRWLPQRQTGLAGQVTAELATSYSALIWSGLLVALIPALIFAMAFDAPRLESALRKAVAPLTRPGPIAYAALAGVLALLLGAAVAAYIDKPTLIDSFAQLTQARYFAAGMLAGPVFPEHEFSHIQLTLVTAHGWVSQYPPGYTALLAIGMLLGATSLVGPVSFGIAIFFTSLVADEVFESRELARVATMLAALSSFMLGQSAAYMSHVPAAAFSIAALYFVLRSTRAGVGNAAVAGLCIGALFTIRPLTAVVAAITATVFALREPRPARERLLRIGLAFAASLPFLVAVAAYNARFFGSPFTFGYQAALGPMGGLGFGVDPWGNRYGLIEAFAYTSAELTALSMHLLETPLPLVLLIGVHFATLRALPARMALLFWWAAALVLANLFYWHHGLFMGPRMLADAGPLWVLLATVAVTGLIARIRADWNIAEKYSVRAFAVGGVAAALLGGVLYLSPQRVLSAGPTSTSIGLLNAPRVDRPAIVFVHGGWTARIAMRLAAHGMRLDSVETALRQNPTCAAHLFAAAYARGEPTERLDFEPRADNLPPTVELSPGNRIRVREGERVVGECAAEMASDAAGVVDVTPFIWQGDMPGVGGKGALFVRDLGPAANEALIRKHPDREPLMLFVDEGGTQSLQAYEAALRSLWGSP